MKDHAIDISVIVPAYNVAATISETLKAILNQTFQNIEIIIVDDGSRDNTPAIIASFKDPRIIAVRQTNRGLAGARNSGIHLARGKYIAFCDSDDLWVPEKLELHFNHLENNSDVGISFSGSRMIDEDGAFLKISQTPKLKNIGAADVFKRNPIGNGSSAVIRREALECLNYRPLHETERDWWFDETLRQSEDIDAWIRFILSADWKIEGIEGHLTYYRIQRGGLSANLAKQFESWCRVRDNVVQTAPSFAAKHVAPATAYQLRYLARRAFTMGDGKAAAKLARQSISWSRAPIYEEPLKTIGTWMAAEALNVFGAAFHTVVSKRLNFNLAIAK